MNKLDINSIPEIISLLEKIEIVAKVLHQTMYGDLGFNSSENRNLCSVMLREISYVKAKLTKLIEI